MSPWRVLVFVAFAVGGAWLWLGGVWAVVAAVFVVPPWCVIAIQWQVVGRRRITADQRAAIRRVRVWQDPVWRWWGAAAIGTFVISLVVALLSDLPGWVFAALALVIHRGFGWAYERAPKGVRLTSWADPQRPDDSV